VLKYVSNTGNTNIRSMFLSAGAFQDNTIHFKHNICQHSRTITLPITGNDVHAFGRELLKVTTFSLQCVGTLSILIQLIKAMVIREETDLLTM